MATEIRIIGTEKLKLAGDHYVRAKDTLRQMISKASDKFAVETQATIVDKYLSGPRPEKLGRVTGRLASSIKFLIDEAADSVTIRFGSDVPYAAIHEFGGDAGPGHKVHIRERAYLRPGIADNLPKFQSDIEEILTMVASMPPGVA